MVLGSSWQPLCTAPSSRTWSSPGIRTTLQDRQGDCREEEVGGGQYGGRCSIWGQERRKRINKLRDTDWEKHKSRDKHEKMAEIESKSLRGRQNDKREMTKHTHQLWSQQCYGSEKTKLCHSNTNQGCCDKSYNHLTNFYWLDIMRTMVTRRAAVTETRKRRWRVNKRRGRSLHGLKVFIFIPLILLKEKGKCECVYEKEIGVIVLLGCEWPWHVQGTMYWEAKTHTLYNAI